MTIQCTRNAGLTFALAKGRGAGGGGRKRRLNICIQLQMQADMLDVSGHNFAHFNISNPP